MGQLLPDAPFLRRAGNLFIRVHAWPPSSCELNASSRPIKRFRSNRPRRTALGHALVRAEALFHAPPATNPRRTGFPWWHPKKNPRRTHQNPPKPKKNSPPPRIRHEARELEKSLEQQPPKVQDIDRKRIEILNTRVEKYEKVRENCRLVDAQCAIVEDVLQLIRDQSVIMPDDGARRTGRASSGKPLRLAALGHLALAQRPRSWDNYNHAGAKARAEAAAKVCTARHPRSLYQIRLEKKHFHLPDCHFPHWPVNESHAREKLSTYCLQ